MNPNNKNMHNNNQNNNNPDMMNQNMENINNFQNNNNFMNNQMNINNNNFMNNQINNNNNQMNYQMGNNYKKDKMMEFKRKRYHPNLELSIMSIIVQEPQSIDKNELNEIKRIIQIEYSNSNKIQGYLSDIITEKIKKKLGGEWFIFICDEKENIPFSISTISDSDFLILKLGSALFKIAKIK